MAKMLAARPRSEGGFVSNTAQEPGQVRSYNLPLALNISAITPPAFVSGDAPKAPAKKRRTMSVWMSWAPAAPALKATRPK